MTTNSRQSTAPLEGPPEAKTMLEPCPVQQSGVGTATTRKGKKKPEPSPIDQSGIDAAVTLVPKPVHPRFEVLRGVYEPIQYQRQRAFLQAALDYHAAHPVMLQV